MGAVDPTMSDGDTLKVYWYVLSSYISGLLLAALPDHYEGYQLYRGLVRGDSIWIEM